MWFSISYMKHQQNIFLDTKFYILRQTMGLISFLRQASSKDGTKGKRQDLTEGCLMQDLRRDLLRSDQRKRAL